MTYHVSDFGVLFTEKKQFFSVYSVRGVMIAAMMPY